MNDESNSHEGQRTSTGSSSKLSIKTRNDLQWDAHKDEIHQIYVEQNNTLRETIQIIEGKHRFKARCVNLLLHITIKSLRVVIVAYSERKWKTKLKEWNFEKHLTSTDLKILVAKNLKRSRDEKKETGFFHNGREIRPEKFKNFKKRKISKLIDSPSPSAGKSTSRAVANK